MIHSWQVWLTRLDPVEEHEQGGDRPVVVVSSPLHLRLMRGQSAIISPITSKFRPVNSQVPVKNDRGETNWVVTEQVRFISTLRFLHTRPLWQLNDAEIAQVRRSMQHMVDF